MNSNEKILQKSNMPLYIQLEQILKSKIVTGEISIGDRIPTEEEYADIYKVSRITVRQAIMNLVHEGLLQRKPGLGTFVVDELAEKHTIMTINVKGGIDDVSPEGVKEQKVNVIDVSIIKGPRRVLEVLNLPEQSEVLRIKRTRNNKSIVYSYIVNYIPILIGERIKKKDLLHMPMLRILNDRLGITLKNGIQSVSSVVADHEVASALSMSVASPVLYLETIIYDDKDNSVEYVQTYFRSAQFKYNLKIEHVNKEHEKEVVINI